MSLLASFDDTVLTAASSQRKQALVGGHFAHNTSSSSGIDWERISLTDLTSHSHGLCSSVYRRALSRAAKWPQHASEEPIASSSTSAPALAEAAAQADGLAGWVCIKRVHADEQPRPHSISREIALLDRLAHRNVAPLLVAIYDTSDPFAAVIDLVMPLYAATLEEVLLEPSLALVAEDAVGAEAARPGNSIRHLWSDSPQRFVQSVSKQLLAGVAYLHHNKVAHRDVKPSNILLTHNGVVKIIDLGTAYTTTPLDDPLATDQSSRTRRREEEKDEWEGGEMVCQVGTGQFRAPELLFSPVGGYDAFAVDVWAVGVTLAHFFTPLTALPRPDASEQQPQQDDRKDWQKAFDSGAPLSPSHSDAESSSSLHWEQEPLPSDTHSDSPVTASGYIRTPLFQPDSGDIGLAASIFALLGLPESTQDWPEAQHFQPPLERLPFAPTNGKGLLEALTLFNHPEGKLQEGSSSLVRNVILPALSLSASKRPTARSLLAAIQSSPLAT